MLNSSTLMELTESLSEWGCWTYSFVRTEGNTSVMLPTAERQLTAVIIQPYEIYGTVYIGDYRPTELTIIKKNNAIYSTTQRHFQHISSGYACWRVRSTLEKRLHLQGTPSKSSSTEDSSADIDILTDSSSERDSFSEKIFSEIVSAE
jgi:hypothetical protein